MIYIDSAKEFRKIKDDTNRITPNSQHSYFMTFIEKARIISTRVLCGLVTERGIELVIRSDKWLDSLEREEEQMERELDELRVQVKAWDNGSTPPRGILKRNEEA